MVIQPSVKCCYWLTSADYDISTIDYVNNSIKVITKGSLTPTGGIELKNRRYFVESSQTYLSPFSENKNYDEFIAAMLICSRSRKNICCEDWSFCRLLCHYACQIILCMSNSFMHVHVYFMHVKLFYACQILICMSNSGSIIVRKIAPQVYRITIQFNISIGNQKRKTKNNLPLSQTKFADRKLISSECWISDSVSFVKLFWPFLIFLKFDHLLFDILKSRAANKAHKNNWVHVATMQLQFHILSMNYFKCFQTGEFESMNCIKIIKY